MNSPLSPLSPRDEANRAQGLASSPGLSAFVAASAGSGKTKLLTDRLLRLLLAGAHPGRIVCLTYTRAAAAEMRIRLQGVLAGWVAADDATLDRGLSALAVAPTPEARAAARALFARVLDLPGGMRIDTIHAFATALLRRFPLEAQVSPHFRTLEEADQSVALATAREAMLAHGFTAPLRAALGLVAGEISLDRFGALAEQLRTADAAPLGDGPALAPRIARALGATESEAALTAGFLTPEGEAARNAASAVLAERGSATVRARGAEMLAWLGCDGPGRDAGREAWRAALFTAKGAPRAESTLVNAALARVEPGLLPLLLAEQARIVRLDDGLRAWRVARLSAAFAALALPVGALYEAARARAGELDFGQLIARARALLDDPGAAWVLYKLDGGIDHLLLDEVQDSAPEQWEIAGALAQEFFAGEGARAPDGTPPRSIFAVGDRKQSIYGFQGADPDGFERWRDRLAAMVVAGGGRFEDVALRVSFRSTAPVLELVDRVFADPASAAGVVAAGDVLTHLADRAGAAGRVELWPLVARVEPPEPEPWAVATRNAAAPHGAVRLAHAIADWLAARFAAGERLESRGRPLRPGDVLVLVRGRRNPFAAALVRALKARGIATAGLDRLRLGEQPAAADLLSLAAALLLPEDDLSFAEFLASPLGGLDDDSLMALAPGRPGALWHALRARAAERPEWARAASFFARLLARVDYASPYALLMEALGPLGGRARLYARFGPEAAEPVDELLAAALRFAASHPPSLQGFLAWLGQSGAEVKREPGAAGDAVRIMTVHGAKGLQAPLVILPDTTALPPEEHGLLWVEEEGARLPLFPVVAAERPARMAARAAERRRLVLEEYNRLLYVGLTRAEDRLVVCGWERGKMSDASWYAQVARAMESLKAEGRAAEVPAPEGLGMPAPDGSAPAEDEAKALVLACPQTAPVPTPPPALEAGTERGAKLPAWVAASLPEEPATPVHLAPSRPEGVEFGEVPPASSPLASTALAAQRLGSRDAAGARFRRGAAVHAALQHLPALAPEARAKAARAWFTRAGVADAEAVTAQVLAVLDDARLAPLWGPASRAEAPLTGLVRGPDGAELVVGGVIDRLAVEADRVLVCDYKTNRRPPAEAARVPVAYLRQLAAYRAVLAQVFPGRAIECWLVWTEGGPLAMALPADLLDRHAPDAPPA